MSLIKEGVLKKDTKNRKELFKYNMASLKLSKLVSMNRCQVRHCIKLKSGRVKEMY